MIRTEEIAEVKSPKGPSLKIYRTTGNVRCAAPAKKCLSHWADRHGLKKINTKIDLNLSSEQYRKIWYPIGQKRYQIHKIAANL